MKDTFDIQDELFDIFRSDSELLGLLGITDSSDIELCDTKIRRQFQDPTLITPDIFQDFFDYSFVDARKTGNYLVNKGLLEFNIYCSFWGNAKLISKSIKRLLKENYEDMQADSESQVGCPVVGIMCYRIRVKPMLSS